MQNFLDIVTHQADDIEQIIISDLHLPLLQPVLMPLGQAFLSFLEQCVCLPHLQKLYILGDWFETWLGDDVADTPQVQASLIPILANLQKLTQQKCEILVMRGNRDFLLGQEFCDKFGGTLIQEPYFIDLASKTIRLEHGDVLCTDDKKYQRFRKVIQHPLSKKLLLALPMQTREQIAQNLRQKSQADNVIKAQKTMQIMDVNATAVENALNNADILLHGHTHRPAIHEINGKQRIVLGDWRVQGDQVIAEIGVIIDKSLQLMRFDYKSSSNKLSSNNQAKLPD